MLEQNALVERFSLPKSPDFTFVVKAAVSCNRRHVLKAYVSPKFSSLLIAIPLNLPYAKPSLLCLICLAFLVFSQLTKLMTKSVLTCFLKSLTSLWNRPFNCMHPPQCCGAGMYFTYINPPNITKLQIYKLHGVMA